MKMQCKTEVFTKKGQFAKIKRFYRNKHQFLGKRYTVKPSEEIGKNEQISAEELINLLQDYFPQVTFFESSNIRNLEVEDLAIGSYAEKKQGKYILRIDKMSKSKNKNFARLLPQRDSYWIEAKAREKYGRPDVIRYFIDMINNFYFHAFSKAIRNRLVHFSKNSMFYKVKRNKAVHFNKNSIPAKFFEDVKYDNAVRSISGSWDFSRAIKHLMKKKSSIYEAFDFYAHKQYTLLSFAFNMAPLDKNTIHNNEIDYLLRTGKKKAIDTVHKKYSQTKKLRNHKHKMKFEIVIERTLESIPRDRSKHAPTNMHKFVKQLYREIPSIYRPDEADIEKYVSDDADSKINHCFTKSDQRTINNNIARIDTYVTNPKDKAELTALMVPARFYEKIKLLYRLINDHSIKEKYDKRAQATIRGLYLKHKKEVPLNEQWYPNTRDKTSMDNSEESDE